MSIHSNPVFPPLDCSLLFSDLITFHLQNNPQLPMFVYPDDQSLQGITEITFLEFGYAAHRVAHVLRPGRAGDERQTVMLIANCDTIHHHAVFAGMCIAGLVPFLVSPRNSAAAVADMMKKTNCSRIVTLHHAHQALVEEVRKVLPRELKVDEIPAFSYVFPKLGREVQDDSFVLYPQPVSRPDLDKPGVYIHSSGSTGFPKPIPISYKIQIHTMTQPMIRALNRSSTSRLGVMGLPAFHSYGVIVQVYIPIAYLVTAAVYAPQAVNNPHVAPIIPTGDNMLDCARRTQCNVLSTVPAFLEQWAVSEEAIVELRKFDLVLYGGGPLAEKIGDELCAAGVAIGTGYGGIEFGAPICFPDIKDIRDGDWMWMRFGNDIKVRWVPQGDGTFECQVLTTENNQMAVENLPDVAGYATSDLFIKHPTKDMWRIVGRVDDVITLASGEKTVPAPMEGVILSSPLLKGAVMFGRERNQVGILVEPISEHTIDVQNEAVVAEFRNKIWPLVEEANKDAPAFSRIFKEMILITSSDKPMLRTPKGTVQKKATVKAYQAEIHALYDAVEATFQSSEGGSAGPSVWTAQVVEEWLTERTSTIAQGRSLDPTVDIFAQGFDSLSVTYLRNQLLNALRKSSDTSVRDAVSRIPMNIIFENPTIRRLAARIASLVGDSAGGDSSTFDLKQQHIEAMDAMIEKYSSGLHGSTNDVVADGMRANGVNGTTANGAIGTHDGHVVLLTGSTGGLGSFLLSQVIESTLVTKVYAFNRPSSLSIKERQRNAFADKDLALDRLNSEKLVYVNTDVSQANCGLSPEMYNEIRTSVTIIIHNAWRLDFNLSLPSFEPNIRATRNLIDLALNSHHRHSLRFVFTSSVGSGQCWDRSQGPFPEEVQLDPSVAVGSGYGESKYVCERILAKSGLDVTSLRIGQIAGGPNGSWATTDWVPIIVKSSLALGGLPDSRGGVSWMRSEDVTSSVLDVAFTKKAPGVLNIINPQRAPWTDIMVSIRDEILKQKLPGVETLPIVPFSEWVARLEKKAESATSEELTIIPAIKLFEFFRALAHGEKLAGHGSSGEAGGMVDFSTTKSQGVSKTMARMRPVGDAEARSWVRYWISKGLF